MGRHKEAYEYRVKYDNLIDSIDVAISTEELVQYSDDLATFKVRLEAKEKQMQLVEVIIILLSLMFLSFIIVTVIFIRRNRQRQEELLQFNEQLTEAKDKAESASRMKSLFVQNMSHEVRTPLNAIMGFSQLLTMPGIEWSEEEMDQYGRAIMTNGNMLTMLIDDILNIADLESGNYTIRKDNANIKKICTSVSEVVEFRLPSDVQYSVNCEVPEDYTLFTDAGRVQQILVNFLTNACKHTEKGSITLDFKLVNDDKTAFFSVTDTGTGIPKEMAEKIFERFEKLDSFKQGTGIGLHLCNMLSIKLGGKVYVDTTYTGGARFVLELPVEQNKQYDPLQCYLDLKAKQNIS
ncbi:MAG: HAMP domain-containing histidine kinase [Bacteroidales bacterium]|nr:HAMP domain-containing histidine kinase [Bacteroidales bacterium]